MDLRFHFKPYSFRLLRPLQTSHGILHKRSGWLIRIQDSLGRCGWGEVSPLGLDDFKECFDLFDVLQSKMTRRSLEDFLMQAPSAFAFGIGAALGELDGLFDYPSDWLEAPESAFLLSKGHQALLDVEVFLKHYSQQTNSLTFKWKVGVESVDEELSILDKLLDILPENIRLRLDANGGWNRAIAKNWANHLRHEERLEWFEQPLPVNDLEGLINLATYVPVALDESLLADTSLRESWFGWQVRRPVIDGDPRPLLNDLKRGRSHRMISTAFETGIGRRWVNHLAAIQHNGPTPTAPGLAPGWFPQDKLFSDNPEIVWQAI
ncbi:o-succinylbenzoate synthase [Prochlorococcus sp. MIT 1341]|uniref:o-succinylbenzoate synthase n=1 Tax=Prochlorococcus sp. MIT 1341 TaxID=3096221 RepID=UPI002A75A16E|nr:o-succinylbenzoate synthase [Prochlorococcus sp. MIT 1341]